VTFDDGYRNNITQALPVLEQHRAPATIFVVSGYTRTPEPLWFDRLDYALQHGARQGDRITVGGREMTITGTDRDTLRDIYAAIRRYAKQAVRDDAEMTRELDSLSDHFERQGGSRLMDVFERDEWSALLTWNEISRASSAAVRFGSHSMHHVRVGRVSAGVARAELEGSRRDIAAHVGDCAHFAYPDGDFTPSVAALTRQCGYRSAVTTIDGLNVPGCDLFTLRRITMPECESGDEMLLRVSGLWEALLRCWRRPKIDPEP
jgi:peptidoglycan/xylan/chitin deacetylase (PgdA/CDA1 family)